MSSAVGYKGNARIQKQKNQRQWLYTAPLAFK
jgi:hypothetical protein